MKPDHALETPPRRFCPARSSRTDVHNVMRLARHVALRLRARADVVLHVDVDRCDGTVARIRPWGWRGAIEVALDDVVAVGTSTVARQEHARAIGDVQRGLEATWPS